MKKFIGFVLISVIIVTIAFGIYNFTNKYDIKNLSNTMECNINFKGLEGAETFDVDEDGRIYVGFRDSIKILDRDGREESIIKDKNFNISDVVYYNRNLYIATSKSIYKYNVSTREMEEILKEIPALGDNKDTKLLMDKGNLYIAIGTNTNSGVVEEKGLPYDRPTSSWVLTGENFGENNTGAFSEYGKVTSKGERLNGQVIGNGCILILNTKNNKVELYAHGIRNIEGWDFNSKNELFAIVGGIEDRGLRPVKNDKDYIYKLKEKEWYGWPDYSGGDPITSGRFTDNTRLNFIIENQPTKIPDGPFYQYKDISALKGFSIDSEGKLFEKDLMIFADNKEHKLYTLSNSGVLTELLELNKNGKVGRIIDYEDGYYILDSKLGVLYKLEMTSSQGLLSINPIFYVVITFICLAIFGIVIYKISKKKNLKK